MVFIALIVTDPASVTSRQRRTSMTEFVEGTLDDGVPVVITGTRIRAPQRHFTRLRDGQSIVVGAPASGKSQRAGFPAQSRPGDTILPAVVGPTTRFNAEGRWLIHRDQPMETAYRTVQWSWREWHGDTPVDQTDWRDVPFQRYPRTRVPAASLELTLATDAGGNEVIVAPAIVYSGATPELLMHAVNVFLELFGEAHLFSTSLRSITMVPHRRINWEILPQGRMPWPQLQEAVQPILQGARNVPLILDRLETINALEPTELFIGRAGFAGYIVFGFPNRRLWVCESRFYGNATYIFREDWAALSQLTKAEIIDGDLHFARLVHHVGWHQQLREVFSRSQVA
jgi:hypothetical protein